MAVVGGRAIVPALPLTTVVFHVSVHSLELRMFMSYRVPLERMDLFIGSS